MHTIRRTFSAVDRCVRAVWKSLRKNCCVLPCFGHRSESTIDDISDGVEFVAAVAEQIVETAPASNVLLRRSGRRVVFDDNVLEFWKCGKMTVTKMAGIKTSAAENGLAVCEKGRSENDRGNDGEKDDVQLHRAVNAWIPAIAARQKATGAGGRTSAEDDTTEEINKTVRSYLNKITPKNFDVLKTGFLELPINTTERLENVVDLIFERAIQEQNFAPRYAALCAALQSVQVCSAGSKPTTSFKWLMIKKCQSLFESDKAHQTVSADELNEINSCTDPEKKIELQLEHEENERKFRIRAVGNCRFIGEMFNLHIIQPKIMSYCITYLICQRSDEPLECLCVLLKTVGKELERFYSLNEVFGTLKTLMSAKNISSRTRFMIQDILDLRINKWSPKLLECDLKTNEKGNGCAFGDNKSLTSGGILCSRCNRSGHLAKDCRATGSVNNTTLSRGSKGGDGRAINCYKCNRSGHLARDCKDKERCYRCDSVSHSSRDCPKFASILCYNCSKKGHLARDCPDERVKRGLGATGNGIGSSFVCYNCNKTGHFSRDCTESRNQNGKYSVLCRNCNGSGHTTRDCPESKTK